MATIASDELREYFDERPGLHAAVLGAMGLVALVVCLWTFLRGGSEYRKWGSLVLTVVFLGQCAYRLWQVREAKNT